MNFYEGFGDCLQRILTETGTSASEAARMVGFRSRNSIFRILAGDTSCDVDSRFLASLRQAVGDLWPQCHWTALETALCIKRAGLHQYLSNQAFLSTLQAEGSSCDYQVETRWHGQSASVSLNELLSELSAAATLDISIRGCFENDLITSILKNLEEAGDAGRVTIRHFIDIRKDIIVHNILSVMPLISKVWYNARLMREEHCSPEMAALYRINCISIEQRHPDGSTVWHELVKYSPTQFVHTSSGSPSPVTRILDERRHELELLKPLQRPCEGANMFVSYTERYEYLERDGMILSIKPDVHFNCIPSRILYPAIIDGFRQAGYASGAELVELIEQLQRIQDARFHNMRTKHRPTHLVYSLPAMRQFMRTGILSDQFFLHRPYSLEERREILRTLLQLAQSPYFNIYFLRSEATEPQYEMTCYEGKGVLMMNAFTCYDLYQDHSEALITLPMFMDSFQRFFLDELLPHHVLTKAESLSVLESLCNAPAI